MRSLAIPRQRFGIDWIEDETVVLQQRVDHGAFPLLERHCNFPAGKALLELCDPLVEHGRLLLELEVLNRPLGRLQMDGVPLVAPIQAHVRHNRFQSALLSFASLAVALGFGPAQAL